MGTARKFSGGSNGGRSQGRDDVGREGPGESEVAKSLAPGVVLVCQFLGSTEEELTRVRAALADTLRVLFRTADEENEGLDDEYLQALLEPNVIFDFTRMLDGAIEALTSLRVLLESPEEMLAVCAASSSEAKDAFAGSRQDDPTRVFLGPAWRRTVREFRGFLRMYSNLAEVQRQVSAERLVVELERQGFPEFCQQTLQRLAGLPIDFLPHTSRKGPRPGRKEQVH